VLNPLVLLGAAVAAVIIGVARISHALWFSREAQARRRLASGRDAIGDHEVVTLSGTVRAPATALTSPLSNRACVAYRIIATARTSPRSPAVQVFEKRAFTPFELELAASRTVTVDGDAAELETRTSPVIPRNLDRELALLAGTEVEADLGTISFEEAIVEVGARIRVHGMTVVETATGGYRDGGTRIRLVAHDAHPLTIGGAR
jgi:hypothetical protein